MNREYYTEVIDEMKRAQGKLSQALYADLDRLAGAESNGTKVKVQEAYERGVKEAFEAIFALYEMHPIDLQQFLKANEMHNMKDFLKSENHLEKLKQAQQMAMVMKAEELKDGDEVRYEGARCVVIEKREGGKVLLFFPATVGSCFGYVKKCEKTGRHFDVTEMMKTIEKMKGDE